MTLILSVTVMCLYLYPVYLVSRVLKNSYFKEHFPKVAFKHSICDIENKTYEFTLCSMLKHSPNEKGMIYGPNGKGIVASMEYSIIIYSPNEKGMVL